MRGNNRTFQAACQNGNMGKLTEGRPQGRLFSFMHFHTHHVREIKSCRTQVTPMKKKLTMELVKSLMEESYTLVWTDCRDNLDGNRDLLQECLDKRSPEPL